jgi:hypothetical protein
MRPSPFNVALGRAKGSTFTRETLLKLYKHIFIYILKKRSRRSNIERGGEGRDHKRDPIAKDQRRGCKIKCKGRAVNRRNEV